MNVEDSYEGAVRRLRRLGHAGVDLAPPSPSDDEQLQQRMRELEQLASLACDDNERLEQELAVARGQIDGLQRQIAMLQQSVLAGQQAPDADVDQLEARLRKRFPYGIVAALLIAGAGAAVLLTLRPWQHRQNAYTVAPLVAPEPVAVVPPPAAPVKVEPAGVPPAAPVPPPVVKAPEPAAAVTMAKVAADPSDASPRAAAAKRRHAKHHRHASARHHGAAHHAAAAKADSDGTSDPLGGISP